MTSIPGLESTDDVLPWEEKYRPHTLDQIVGQGQILDVIRRFATFRNVPHMLFYGPPGTGKTSTALALARSLYGTNMAQMVLELNASNDRGVETVQIQIKAFSSMRHIFNESHGREPPDVVSQWKLVILDEAETMEYTAQMALRRIMDDYAANTRFCIITNHFQKLSPSLVSRCVRFRFKPLSLSAIRAQILKVIEQENIQLQPQALESLTYVSNGDMRQALSILQESFSSESSISTKSASPAQSFHQLGKITSDTIYRYAIVPSPSDIDNIIQAVLSRRQFTSFVSCINEIRDNRGVELASIVRALNEKLQNLHVSDYAKIFWLEELANIEYRLACGGSEDMQTGAIVGTLREGASLSEN